jgi:hypothetical protein
VGGEVHDGPTARFSVGESPAAQPLRIVVMRPTRGIATVYQAFGQVVWIGEGSRLESVQVAGQACSRMREQDSLHEVDASALHCDLCSLCRAIDVSNRG